MNGNSFNQAGYYGGCMLEGGTYERYTVVPGKNFAMNAAASRRDPVPDSDCSVAMRFCNRYRTCISNALTLMT